MERWNDGAMERRMVFPLLRCSGARIFTYSIPPSLVPPVVRTSDAGTRSVQGDPALRYAFRLLSYRGRSEKEMAGRLRRKGFDVEADRVMEYLRSAGLLDDRKLASSLRRYAGESKYLSILGTKKLLVERGVPQDLIEEAVNDIDETGLAEKLVEKKIASWRKYSSPGKGHGLTPEEVRRLYGFLARRGYQPETIKKALGKYKP